MAGWTRLAQTIEQYKILAAIGKQLNGNHFTVRIDDDGDVIVTDIEGNLARAYLDIRGELQLAEI